MEGEMKIFQDYSQNENSPRSPLAICQSLAITRALRLLPQSVAEVALEADEKKRAERRLD